ncbi:MAG: carboxypeptidase M32 [Candidatus Poribacteria bacterium]|nr:carboxypeptidase M32 [Candidatus Poribacteria bacterium]
MPSTYERFMEQVKKVHTLASVSRLLSWDMQTYMPPKGGTLRGEQLALIRGEMHDIIAGDAMGAFLNELSSPNGADPVRATNIREMRREHDRARKIPKAYVEELTRVTSKAKSSWSEARKNKDFGLFADDLKKIIELKRNEAGYVGFDTNPYDALLTEYEPGSSAESVGAMFAPLREGITPLLKQVLESPTQPDVSITRHPLSEERQREFGASIAKDFGFDFDSGRLDKSAHPFCSGFHPGDVRMTARYNEHEPMSSLFAILHETGHGLYNQGLDAAYFGTPCGESVSLGVHESQSRLWENNVGRSKPFWSRYLPKLKATYGGALDDVSLDEFHFAVNAVHLSPIRVEADELTYNLHILLRFELENDLINGNVSVDALPETWDAKMERYLHLTPPDVSQGCLQDIHWSFGGIGYFPTYTIGNLYAAQLDAAIRRDIPKLDAQIARGEFGELLGWLREKIHRHGMRYASEQVIEEATGERPDGTYFVNYLRDKYAPLYKL